MLEFRQSTYLGWLFGHNLDRVPMHRAAEPQPEPVVGAEGKPFITIHDKRERRESWPKEEDKEGVRTDLRMDK